MQPRAVWYRKKITESKWIGGTLHAWSIDTEASDVHPAAVVEDDKTGEIVVTRVQNIRFKNP